MEQCLLSILVLLTFVKVISIDAALSQCYSDRLSWQFGQYCIEANFHEIDWDDARADCKKRGGDLLEVRTREMQLSVENHLKRSGHHPAGYWFGATDRNHEDQWEWLHDDKKILYKNWDSGQGPDQSGFFFSDGGLEDCAMIRPGDGYKWHDGPCAGGFAFHYASLCQYDLQQTTSKPTKAPTYVQTSKPTQKATTVKPTTNVPHSTEAPTYAKTSKPTSKSTTVNPTSKTPTLMSILSTQKSTILTQPPFPTGTFPPKATTDKATTSAPTKQVVTDKPTTKAEIDTTAPPQNTPPVTNLPTKTTTIKPTTTTTHAVGVIVG